MTSVMHVAADPSCCIERKAQTTTKAKSRKINLVLSHYLLRFCLIVVSHMPTRLPPSLAPLQSDQTLICAHLFPAMQRLTDALGAGYLSYVTGCIPLAQASRVLTKLQTRYPGLTRDRKHAYRQGKLGLARYKLIAHSNRSAGNLVFFLLTDSPELDNQETWLNATVKRTRLLLYQYEALQMTKAGTHAPVWTWHLSKEVLDEYRETLKVAIRLGRVDSIKAFIEQSRTWPGFYGVREQRAALRHAIEGEWKRTMPEGAPMPTWPRLRYLQRLATR